MADDEPQTRSICCCDDRHFARFRGEFVFMERWAGWVFVEGPTRRMSPAAKYFALIDRSQFDHHDHTGEPFVWLTCPWCGGDLPPQDSVNPYLGFGGCEGEES